MSSPVSPPLTVETIDGATVGRPITKIKVTNGTLAVSGSTATLTISGGGGGGTGTVTSVGSSQAFITITNPTTTPSISIGNASGAATGVLTAASFNTFDAKQDAITLTTTGTSGAATFAGGTLNIPQYTDSGGTIGGSITSTQVARGATTADEIEGDNGLLFDGTSFTVNTLSANNPVLNMSSNTKSVSLEVETSQTLSIKGGSNKFIFDASTATAGITFPDGTTQNTASTGSGGAPTDAEYITLSANGSLTNERVITAGTGIGFTDGGAGSALTIFNAGVTLLTAGTGISLNSSTGGVIITNTVAEGTITGTITDNQIAVGATTANELEGNAKFTYDQATQSLNIAAGTGTGTILSGSSDMVIRNSSGVAHSKITLEHDAANSNIKLDTDGTGLVEIHKEGTLAYSLPNVVTVDNDYVLTAQTDGSTAWAASGGGGGGASGSMIYGSPNGDWGTGGTVIQNITSNGWSSSQASTTTNLSSGYQLCRPFVSSMGADVTKMSLRVTTASAGSNIRVGIYNADSGDGNPTSLIGYGEFDSSSTGTKTVTSFSSTITLVRGSPYWFVVVATSGSPSVSSMNATYANALYLSNSYQATAWCMVDQTNTNVLSDPLSVSTMYGDNGSYAPIYVGIGFL